MSYWGYHAMFDCKNCKRVLVQDGENIRAFVNEVVPGIDMMAYVMYAHHIGRHTI